MFLLDYFSKIKDSTAKAEKMTRSHKSMFYNTILDGILSDTELFSLVMY